MGLTEYIVFDSITCIIGCVLIYFIDEMKSYDKIQLISNSDKSEKENKLLIFENLKLLHPIKEQPHALIILQK